jgi:pimeloyl-ACP methyl ester carboxylesterase
MISEWTSTTLKINGNDIHLTRTGGKKPPLVLAHGFTDDGLCWTDFALKFELLYDLIMVDAIGHGESSRIPKDGKFDMVDDLYKVIQELGLQKPTLIGHSMGALVGSGLAALYPDLLSNLILEDVPWFDGLPPVKPEKNDKEEKEKFPDIVTKLQQGTLKEAVKFSKKYNPHWVDTMHEHWARSKMKFDLNLYSIKWPEPPKWKSIASHITCPTLLLTGDVSKGALVTPKLALEALKLMPKAEWGAVPGAGHCIRYEQFDTYVRIVKKFLEVHFSPANYTAFKFDGC